MKKVFVVLIFAGLVLFTGNAFSQSTIKLGHIDSRAVFSAMPESDSATKQLEREAAVMQQTLEELQVEFNKKYEDYIKMTNDPNASPLILRTKEEELQTIQQRSQTFQQQAEESISQKRVQLFQPIQEKAVKAVNDVAAENGFSYFFDTSCVMIAYRSPES
jgi:outer membrane protein